MHANAILAAAAGSTDDDTNGPLAAVADEQWEAEKAQWEEAGRLGRLINSFAVPLKDAPHMPISSGHD
jgi:hypothetical protein